MGEFEHLESTDEGEGSKNIKILLWLYFLLATLISQIIMFNTLIAILGDTYGRILESQLYYAVKAKTEIYSDFMYFIKGVNCIDKFTK